MSSGGCGNWEYSGTTDASLHVRFGVRVWNQMHCGCRSISTAPESRTSLGTTAERGMLTLRLSSPPLQIDRSPWVDGRTGVPLTLQRTLPPLTTLTAPTHPQRSREFRNESPISVVGSAC